MPVFLPPSANELGHHGQCGGMLIKIMLTFFCGWRRKIGAVTLMLACVFAAGWLRSLTHNDRSELSIYDDHLGNFWCSHDGTIQCVGFRVKSVPYGDGLREVLDEDIELSIPYWLLTIPPTLLSALLFLNKPVKLSGST